jgi:hypothetical protein
MQRFVAKPPLGIGLLHYALCGVVSADSDEPGQALQLLRLIARAGDSGVMNHNDLQLALAPRQLAGWDPAALPAELQPYGVHFRIVWSALQIRMECTSESYGVHFRIVWSALQNRMECTSESSSCCSELRTVDGSHEHPRLCMDVCGTHCKAGQLSPFNTRDCMLSNRSTDAFGLHN